MSAEFLQRVMDAKRRQMSLLGDAEREAVRDAALAGAPRRAGPASASNCWRTRRRLSPSSSATRHRQETFSPEPIRSRSRASTRPAARRPCRC